MTIAGPLEWCPELAALDAPGRADLARTLSSAQRIATLGALADTNTNTNANVGGGDATDRRPRDCAELLGLLRFQEWLHASGRVVGDRGSPWWRVVNGSMVLDIVEATAPQRPASGAVPPAAWDRYLQHTGGGRVRAFWTAHQASLRAATAVAGAVLAEEPEREQVFIGAALASVGLAARANLPSAGVGAHLIEAFCTTCFPRTYCSGGSPAQSRRDRAVRVSAARTRRHVQRWAAGS